MMVGKKSILFFFGLVSGDTGSGDARCHIYYAGSSPTACGHVPTEADVSEPCGATVADPCISTMNGVVWDAEECWDCYKVTMENKYKPKMECTDEACPAFRREVFLKIVDGNYNAEKFEMGQMAWKRLCPLLCHHSEQCTDDASNCLNGETTPDDPNVPNFPGSCKAEKHPVSWEPVECETGTHPTDAPAPTDGIPEDGIDVVVGPTVLCPGYVSACEIKLPALNECGATADDPCPASANEMAEIEGMPDDECNTCIRVEFEQEATSSEACKDSTCPAVKHTVYARIEDKHSQTNQAPIMLGSNGWSRICPFTCVGDVCADDEDTCTAAVEDFEFCDQVGDGEQTIPGTAIASPRKMKVYPCLEIAGAVSVALPSLAVLLLAGLL